ncbi:MAG: right-handed parallel beta-helix repeat-containing protein [Methanosphaera sp.]|nr:right-handed parallel beta-helix repeat-containing protein [Methanosphaera sp.]
MNVNFKKVGLLLLILFVGISVVSASDDLDDNTLEQTYESQQVVESNSYDNIENTNINENVMNQNVERSIKTENKNIIINSNNFDEYVTDGKFNDKVSDGDTVDFQGKFDSSRFNLTVNKTLNIIGSDNNYINLNGESIFKINSGASGSNITGINFEHTRIMIENVTNLNFNNCSVIAEHNVGFGVGMFSVRDGSDNITISNSYFETANNGGHSNVVFAGATNVLFENNTIVGKSTVGNLLYLTTYNSPAENLTYGNQNITIRNNYIDGNEVHIAEICYAIALEGNNILIENNTVEYNGKCIVPQWGQGKQNNITIINNTIPYGTCYLSFPNQTTKGNILNNVQSNNNVLCNNTIKNITTLGNLTLEENNIETITINGSNILINNNNITTTEDYAITIIDTSDNVSIINNKIASGNGQGLNAINGTPTTNENNSATNRIIYINNENIENFFTIKSTSMQNQYTLKDNIYENDTIVLSLTETSNKTSVSYNLRNVPSINIVNSTIISDNLVSFTINSSSKLINSTILLGNINAYNSSVINCTVFNVTYYNESIDNIEVSKLIQNGNYVLKNTNKTINRIPFIKVVNSETGLLNENIIEGDNIYVNGYNNETTNIIIDRPINLIGLNKICTINSNITFIEGSEESNITNITFNGTVNVNTTNINFFEGNTFNGEVNNPYLPETNIPIQINMDYSNQVVNNVPSPVNINVTTTKDVPLTNGYIEVYADGILQDKLNITGSIVHTNITIKRVLNTTIRVWYYPEDNTYLENNQCCQVKRIFV